MVDSTENREQPELIEQVGMEDDEAMSASDKAPSPHPFPTDEELNFFFERKYSPEKDLESRKQMFNMKYGRKPCVEKGTKSAMTGRTTS